MRPLLFLSFFVSTSAFGDCKASFEKDMSLSKQILSINRGDSARLAAMIRSQAQNILKVEKVDNPDNLSFNKKAKLYFSHYSVGLKSISLIFNDGGLINSYRITENKQASEYHCAGESDAQK